MKILLPKQIIENEFQKLGTDFVFDFQDFIKIEHLKTKPFDLKNYSLIFQQCKCRNRSLKINLNLTKIS